LANAKAKIDAVSEKGDADMIPAGKKSTAKAVLGATATIGGVGVAVVAAVVAATLLKKNSNEKDGRNM
jgi:hypothetical protein